MTTRRRNPGFTLTLPSGKQLTAAEAQLFTSAGLPIESDDDAVLAMFAGAHFGKEPTMTTQPVPQVEPRNGYGLAALITAAVGAAAGLIPLLFWIAGPCGIIGFSLALANRARIKRGVATNRKSTWWALALSVVAFGLCIVGISIIVHGLNDVQHQIDQIPSFTPAS